MDDLDITFKLSFPATGYNSDTFILELDGTSFDDLEEFKEDGEVPEVGHST